ncbi:MAG: DNA repair protein RadA [Oscillospiraceae bacterium]
MSKIKSTYICNHCGYETSKWLGKCPECNEWNTFEETLKAPPIEKNKMLPSIQTSNLSVFSINDIDSNEDDRYDTGIGELNRVLGSGIVKGSVVLLSGDPGIGKSTILLQMSANLSKSEKVLYVTGEESPRQIKIRAQRLGVDSDNLLIASTTDIEQVILTIETLRPSVVVVDSIQTMYLSQLQSSAGSITQVRECTQRLIFCAKGNEIPIFIVGHVNKDGAIAGPKIMEHMVDTVLYFEGEKSLAYRILRAVKNRYGSTNEIGVFQMSDLGLEEVENPSAMLLSGRPQNVSGSCIACVMEGSRPILAEVQALVSKTAFGTPRRTSTGFDYNRTALLLAVLEKRCGYFFGNMDAYINVVGGLRLDEPAADLPVAMAVISNLTGKVASSDMVAFGEIGLGGEIRTVTNMQIRVNEAYRLGFKKCIVPSFAVSKIRIEAMPDIELIGVRTLSEACKYLQKNG